MSITGTARRRAAEGRRRAGRRAGGPVLDGRDPRRARVPPARPGRASGSRSICCRRCSPALVNQALGVHDRGRGPASGWATRIRASRRTSRCVRGSRTRAWRSATIASSARCASVLGVAGAGGRSALRDERGTRREPRRAAGRARGEARPQAGAVGGAADRPRRPGGRRQRHRGRVRRSQRDLGLEPVVSIARDDGTTVSSRATRFGLSVTPPTYRSPPPRFPPRFG